MAYVACVEGGFTDKKLSLLFDVVQSTIDKWKHDFPEFKAALKKGKDKFDAEVVEKSFLKRCVGFSYNETTREPMLVDDFDNLDDEGRPGKVLKMVVTKRIRKYVVPDAKGCMDWLCNRRPDRWKKLKHVEIAGKDGASIKTQGLVAVPSGPLTIAEWERQVREALENDKKADLNSGSADGALDTPGGSPG